MPKLTKLWIDGPGFMSGEEMAIRADFDNDRHYRASIIWPGGADQVANALFDLANMIAVDPHLRTTSELEKP